MSGAAITAGLAAIAFAGLVVVARGWQTTERVARVDVRGARLVSVDEIQQQAQVAPRMRFGAIDLAEIRVRLLAHPLVRRASVVREKDVLVLNVTERSPVARVILGGVSRLVDGEGVLFPQRDLNAVLDLPLVCGVTTTAGEKLDSAALMDALAVLRAADTPGVALSGMISAVRRAHDGSFWIETATDATPVRLGSVDDARAKFHVLQAFLPQLMRRGARRAQYVDLRFRDQVVVRWIDPVKAQ